MLGSSAAAGLGRRRHRLCLSNLCLCRDEWKLRQGASTPTSQRWAAPGMPSASCFSDSGMGPTGEQFFFFLKEWNRIKKKNEQNAPHAVQVSFCEPCVSGVEEGQVQALRTPGHPLLALPQGPPRVRRLWGRGQGQTPPLLPSQTAPPVTGPEVPLLVPPSPCAEPCPSPCLSIVPNPAGARGRPRVWACVRVLRTCKPYPPSLPRQRML